MKCDNSSAIEWIRDDEGNPLALIVRRDYHPSSTEFPTPPEFKQQVGFIVYKKGEVIQRHVHLPVERHLTGSSEVVTVREGKAKVFFYKQDKSLVTSSVVSRGDLVLLVAGGHGFELLEDTVLLEVKQGPYTDLEEKERF